MSLISLSPLRRISGQLNVLIRASEWWGYKFSPLLATAYATAILTNVTLWSLLPCLLLLLLSLTVGAAYVSLLNDWTDRTIDQVAGKSNRLANKSGAFVNTLLGVCVTAGFGFGLFFWRLAPVVSLCYAGAWIAYSLYSLPPVRLKVRGLAGVLADAAGAHLFPQLFTVALISHWTGHVVSIAWWWAVGTWSLACGIRNILWHQLSDVTADRRAGIHTLVTRAGELFVRRFGHWFIFPIEVLAFSSLLVELNQPGTLIALTVYIGVEAMHWQLWRIRPLVLSPNQRLVLNEYYITFYPLALLLTRSLQYPLDGVVLGLHLLLFGGHVAISLRNIRNVAGHLLHSAR